MRERVKVCGLARWSTGVSLKRIVGLHLFSLFLRNRVWSSVLPEMFKSRKLTAKRKADVFDFLYLRSEKCH